MSQQNAPTTKVRHMIEESMEVQLNNGITLVASYNEGYLYQGGEWNEETQDYDVEVKPSYYTISSHSGLMPAFHTDEFATLQELANAMRDYADLRKWRKLDIEA